MLTVHHLGTSQSERVVWLCEELGLDYELKVYQRDPVWSPAAYQALHPLGAAPVIQDGDLTLAESVACIEYINQIHGSGKLSIKPGEKSYTDFLYWFHFGNGTLQPGVSRMMPLRIAGVPDDNPLVQGLLKKLGNSLKFMDERLSKVPWLAGERFTAADIVSVFSLTTMRQFQPVDLSEYPHILKWLQRAVEREGYKRAMQKGDPEIDVQAQIKGASPPLFKAMRQL